MTLDPSIILSGQHLNMLDVYDKSNRMAAETLDRRRQSEYQNMLSEYGPGIARGDQGALDMFATYDPTAALNIQQTRRDMDFGARKMDILDAQERRAAEEYARRISAEQRAAEAAQIEDAVKMGLMIPDAASWDQYMTANSPDLVGQFNNRKSIAARYMGMADVLKQVLPDPVDPTKGAPDNMMWAEPGNPQAGVVPIPGAQPKAGFRPATPEEAGQYGAAAGQFGGDGRFYPITPPTGMSVETGPDGQLRIVQGPGAGAGNPKFTEGQSKDNVYATRAEGALATFEPVASELTDRGQQVAEMAPLGLGRGLQTDQFQVAMNAGTEFLHAILRKDTGAAITSEEMKQYGTVYLPQPGDGEAVLAAKRDARIRAVEALKSGMSAEQLAVSDRALVEAAKRAEEGGQPAPEAAKPAAPVRKRFNPATGAFE